MSSLYIASASAPIAINWSLTFEFSNVETTTFRLSTVTSVNPKLFKNPINAGDSFIFFANSSFISFFIVSGIPDTVAASSFTP